MKLGRICGAACLGSLLSVGTLSADVFDRANEIDLESPPPELAQLREEMANQSAIGGHFAESRAFAFKRGETVLAGRMAFVPGKGLALYYEEPEQRAIILLQDSLLEIDSEGKKHWQSLPAQFAALNSIFSLDVAALARSYTLYYAGDVDSWTLGLDNEPEPIRGGRRPQADHPYKISVSGKGHTVSDIIIERPGSIRVTIQMQDIAPLSAEAKQDLVETLEQ